MIWKDGAIFLDGPTFRYNFNDGDDSVVDDCEDVDDDYNDSYDDDGDDNEDGDVDGVGVPADVVCRVFQLHFTASYFPPQNWLCGHHRHIGDFNDGDYDVLISLLALCVFITCVIFQKSLGQWVLVDWLFKQVERLFQVAQRLFQVTQRLFQVFGRLFHIQVIGGW